MDRLTPVNKVGLTGQVVKKIKDYIENGGLTPGKRLPSERELAERLGVSRGITREALKALEAMGIVEIKVGDGTYVADRSYTMLFDHVTEKFPLNIADNRCLLEARIGFECAAFSLAVERITSDELIRMEAYIIRMSQASTQEDKVRADMDFHISLLRAAHNPILAEMAGFLRWYFLKGIPAIGGVELDGELTPELLAKDVREHRGVLDALRHGQPELGKRILTEHLMSAIERNTQLQTIRDEISEIDRIVEVDDSTENQSYRAESTSENLETNISQTGSVMNGNTGVVKNRPYID